MKYPQIDFRYAHVAIYRDGQHAWYRRKLRPAEVEVSHDQKHWVYDLSGYGKGSLKEFKEWVAITFPAEAEVIQRRGRTLTKHGMGNAALEQVK